MSHPSNLPFTDYTACSYPMYHSLLPYSLLMSNSIIPYSSCHSVSPAYGMP